MNTIAFQDHELISGRVKVGNEWQTRTFPVVGGRPRIVHESNQSLSIRTGIVRLEADSVVVKASVQTEKGSFTGTGTAAAQRDARLAAALVELAETRAIARALGFGGIGLEFTGAEDVSHIGNSEPEADDRKYRAFGPRDGNGKPAANALVTRAQVRALHALTKKASYAQEDTEGLLNPLGVNSFNELPRQEASRLISYLQTEVAA